MPVRMPAPPKLTDMPAALPEQFFADRLKIIPMRCPICRRTVDLLVDDHCHHSGIHRARICRDCNAGLGFFHENAAALKRAATYLEAFRHRHPRVGVDHRAETLSWLKRQHAKRFS